MCEESLHHASPFEVRVKIVLIFRYRIIIPCCSPSNRHRRPRKRVYVFRCVKTVTSSPPCGRGLHGQIAAATWGYWPTWRSTWYRKMPWQLPASTPAATRSTPSETQPALRTRPRLCPRLCLLNRPLRRRSSRASNEW